MSYGMEMLHIRKRFYPVVAVDDISLRVKVGEIHAVLGENGAGKSTLMQILFGLAHADEGTIKIRGEDVSIKSPKDAHALGIGMVHQSPKLVRNLTVRENVILGKEGCFFLGKRSATKTIQALSETYALHIDAGMMVEHCSVGIQQRIEILKMLYRKAEILIFDEPTASLTPLEIKDLMQIMRNLVSEGKTIIFVTPRIKEVKEVADRCTIIRGGKLAGVVDVRKTSQAEMFAMMSGRPLGFKAEVRPTLAGRSVLELYDLEVLDNKKKLCLKRLNLSVKIGEIIGIAGGERNGQTELIEAITGLRSVEGGTIILNGNDITYASVRKRNEIGLGYIPCEWQRRALLMEETLCTNLAIKEFSHRPFSNRGVLNAEVLTQHAEALITQFDVQGGEGVFSLATSLSEENRQKLVVGREITREPDLLIAEQPTRALDLQATEFIHSLLIAHREKGHAVLLISSDLDELFKLSDRIAVIHSGSIIGVVQSKESDAVSVGLMMAGIEPKDSGR